MRQQPTKEFELLTRAVDVIRNEIDEEMPMQQLFLFLHIAAAEGITTKELVKTTNLSQSSISKNVRKLSCWMKDLDPIDVEDRILAGGVVVGNKEVLGHGLIVKHPNKSNKKTDSVYLTKKGKDIIKKLTSPV